MKSLAEVRTAEQLEDVLSEPYPEDVEAMRRIGGDFLVLGAGGKMGPTLVLRLLKAVRLAQSPSRVYAASIFGDKNQAEGLASAGASVLPVDFLEERTLESLPDCPNVIYMAGMKFGTVGQEDTTWAINSYLPGRVAVRFSSSRIVAFSTGNVYPLVPLASGGSREGDLVGPVGEYAQSCLGRERILSFFSMRNETPLCLLRLNYAVEARYGVLLDIAQKVFNRKPVSVDMGYANVIWQGDANSVCLRAFQLCSVPPRILNLTGKEILSVRSIAEQFGRHFGLEPLFVGQEAETALLNNASQCHDLFGTPRAAVDQVIELVARWVQSDAPTLGKPTKFEARDGRF